MAATVCGRCGSTERRPNGKGCAACNRRTSREQAQRKRAARHCLPVITPLMRDYLAAFDDFLMARKDGDSRAVWEAMVRKARLLEAMEDAAL